MGVKVSRVRACSTSFSLVFMSRGRVTITRVLRDLGVDLSGVSLAALALPSLCLAPRIRSPRVQKENSLRLPSLLEQMPVLWVSPCVSSALEAAKG
jgi:hypothetical protein